MKDEKKQKCLSPEQFLPIYKDTWNFPGLDIYPD